MVSKIYACQKYMDIRNIYIYMHIYIYNMYIYIYACQKYIHVSSKIHACRKYMHTFSEIQDNLICSAGFPRFRSLKIWAENIFTRY